MVHKIVGKGQHITKRDNFAPKIRERPLHIGKRDLVVIFFHKSSLITLAGIANNETVISRVGKGESWTDPFGIKRGWIDQAKKREVVAIVIPRSGRIVTKINDFLDLESWAMREEPIRRTRRRWKYPKNRRRLVELPR